MLGYEPAVVHLAASKLSEVWQDMQKIADALGIASKGREVVASLKKRIEAATEACRGRSRWKVACVQWQVSGSMRRR